MKRRTVYHVTPSHGNWAVMEEGCPDGQSTYETKDEAIAQARQRAHSVRGHMVVHTAPFAP